MPFSSCWRTGFRNALIGNVETGYYHFSRSGTLRWHRSHGETVLFGEIWLR